MIKSHSSTHLDYEINKIKKLYKIELAHLIRDMLEPILRL